MKEMFVGLDIHAEEFYGTILDVQGESISPEWSARLPNRKKAIQCFFAGIPGYVVKQYVEIIEEFKKKEEEQAVLVTER